MTDFPPTATQDLQRFALLSRKFQDGSLSDVEFRAFRVPLGIYRQRGDDLYMVRVRLPSGAVLPDQLRRLASLARDHGSGELHLTTRQGIQIHDVPVEGLSAVLHGLADVGLSTRGCGGNTVRNITVCPLSGSCPDEVFDVAPYADALTEWLLQDPLSLRLPRKFKVSFAACEKDCVGASANDVALYPRRRDGHNGFAVHVGGGMGADSRICHPLVEFVPVSRVHEVVEALVRVFDLEGDRRDPRRARLRFVVERLGWEAFVQRFEEERARLGTLPPLRPAEAQRRPRRPRPINGFPPEPGFETWVDGLVQDASWPDFHVVSLPVFLGLIDAHRLEALAQVVEDHGEGSVRATSDQNLALRWVSTAELIALHRRLVTLDLTTPPTTRSMVACAGASTCTLGMCRSRGMARAIAEILPPAETPGVRVHISGCPDACGRHGLGDIGLVGAVRRHGGRLVPYYTVQLGGSPGEGSTRYGEGALVLPARNVPAFVQELLTAFRGSAQHPDLAAFLAAGGHRLAEQIAGRHRAVPTFDDDPSAYQDWGSDAPFSLQGRGPGECGAGVFDLIEVDLDSAAAAAAEGQLHAAIVHAARALLVTRGEEAGDDLEALTLFQRHMIDRGAVHHDFGDLLARARQGLLAVETSNGRGLDPAEVDSFVAAVRTLYDGMDASLRFRPAAEPPRDEPPPGDPPAGPGESPRAADRSEDFRGVVCPLNYVKTKMVLGQMGAGAVLSVLLDEQGAANVPESVERDGHRVLGLRERDHHWELTIQRS